MSLKTILFTRKKQVEVLPGTAKNLNLVNAISANIAVYGYAFSSDLHKALATLNTTELSQFNTWISDQCCQSVGAHTKHKPLFRNFPEDIPEIQEYLWKRIVGFIQNAFDITPDNAKLLSCGHLVDTNVFDLSNFGACPICQMQVDEVDLSPSKARKKEDEYFNIKFIGLAPKDAAFNVLTNLVQSKSSISAEDQKDLSELITHFIDNNPVKLRNLLTLENITHKEVLAVVVATALKNQFMPEIDFKNITDVLRVAVALSDGDVSLAKNTKFISFSRKIRKQLLNWLDNCVNIEEDLTRHSNRWIALSEKLHPGEFAKQFPKFYAAVSKIRNNITIEKFSTITDRYLQAKNVLDLAKHLKSRPTEFGRRLDFMLSNCMTQDANSILKYFKECAKTIPTATLLQIYANFNNRNEKNSERFFFPKGQLAKIQVIEENRKILDKDICDSVQFSINQILLKRFAKSSSMGKVYIDEALKNFIVPFNQRSASKALRTIVRGSRVQLPDVSTIRFFIYWQEPKGIRTDLDLTAGMYDENWNFKERIAFTNYKSYNCIHSGDIQSAPNGASEFIDIDRQSALQAGIRYVFMNVYSYTMTPLVNLPICFAGLMGRNKPKSNEIFEPTTVEHKFDLTADTNVALPLILDLKTNEVIWTDISMQNNHSFWNCIEGNSKSVGKIGSAMCQMTKTKFNLYDLLKLHASSRGCIVNNREEADMIFDTSNIPFENDKIVSEYLV